MSFQVFHLNLEENFFSLNFSPNFIWKKENLHEKNSIKIFILKKKNETSFMRNWKVFRRTRFLRELKFFSKFFSIEPMNKFLSKMDIIQISIFFVFSSFCIANLEKIKKKLLSAYLSFSHRYEFGSDELESLKLKK